MKHSLKNLFFLLLVGAVAILIAATLGYPPGALEAIKRSVSDLTSHLMSPLRALIEELAAYW